MENFSVNESVICVHKFIVYDDPNLICIPKENASYRIRKIFSPPHKGAEQFILLKEVVNPGYGIEGCSLNEIGFSAKYFKTVTKKKTSIKVFNNILKECVGQIESPVDYYRE